MTKNEKQKLASKCGHEYVYSGKTKSGYFKEVSDARNLVVDPEDMRKLHEVIGQEK